MESVITPIVLYSNNSFLIHTPNTNLGTAVSLCDCCMLVNERHVHGRVWGWSIVPQLKQHIIARRPAFQTENSQHIKCHQSTKGTG